ncbi:MAG TPA: fatty acyl-AMP ligase [Ktedonobacteraceae bacterium]|nr:fatty acyl-AMP ligase [Ktedonobacteraceae bacterium]
MNNHLAIPVAGTTNLVNLIQTRAQEHPDRLAFTFLYQGEKIDGQLTYAEVLRKAQAIGAFLQHKGASGKPVLLLHHPGLEYVTAFFGCLFAGAIAVPAYAPRSARLLSRIEAIVTDTESTHLLTTSTMLADLQRSFELVPALRRGELIATDMIPLEWASTWQDMNQDGEALAYLQYTSGSITTPKGVMITHENALSNLDMMFRYCMLPEQNHMVCWAPPYHDMGLVSGILLPVYAGCGSTLMSPVAFLQRPFRWLQAISRMRGTISVGPNFSFDLCVRKTTPEQRASLDLSCWSSACNGAEPIHPQTLRRFVEAFAPCGFSPAALSPCYGLAESTLIVATSTGRAFPKTLTLKRAALEEHRVVVVEQTDEESRELVGCEAVPQEETLRIVHPQTLLSCAPDEIGEIWIASKSIGAGYWRKPEETASTFQAFIKDSGEGPFMRSGDLGFIHEGTLFITGRHKDVLIIRGRNLYPQDIELTVEESHEAIRSSCSVAFTIEKDEQEQLVVIAEIDPHYLPTQRQSELSPVRRLLDPEELRKRVRLEIWEAHDVQALHILFVTAGSVPKTSSGKIQRRLCRQLYLAGELPRWDA